MDDMPVDPLPAEMMDPEELEDPVMMAPNPMPMPIEEEPLDFETGLKIGRGMGAPSVRSPNPPSNTGCRDAWDCHGTGVYCYKGWWGQPNYCMRGNGIGSVCRNTS